MNINATEQVALYLDNVECLYNDMRDVCESLTGVYASDQSRIDHVADLLELYTTEHYLNGQETDAGDWLIRAFLASVGWQEIATSFYSDYAADQGE